MHSINWSGVFPALLTPFDSNDKVDFAMYKTNLDAQISAGVDGIIIGGSLGEASTLLNQEKKELLIYSKELVPSGFPVLVNIAEQSTADAVALAREAEANGADGLMLLPPMRYKSSDEETVAFFKAVADSTSLPIMIYNNPVDYKIEVTLDMFESLADRPNIQAVKESTRDTVNITRMINRFGDRFKILTGVDPLALESLVLGADGWVAGLVDAFPRETVAIFRLVKAGRIDEAVRIYRWFMPLLELDIHPKLVQYIKLAAVATGIGSETVRTPRLPLTGAERTSVLKTINDALAVRPELPDYFQIKTNADVAWT
ncbi:dihydrodipicolinate synthase family protein [Flavihumibacter petaseus]|uniref:Putative dihydrodipicolinate synthase n=1 Tax=Flavihumibacter petaseus NBRC 106054 TaxID=1220578 RepID=A0A0E9MX99_9BACT|nr:dihydrodipicolinate synthase family protein [Flavihumibacter petaseus]GAO42123.1 putative dihydrodipicolinate synthase [Flavihumibacter petaseus NBRC 106054]